jgi:N-methylhydantoinase B
VHTHMTNSWNTPVEALEHQFPLRITEYSVRRDSGGSGARRGGDGVVREYEFLQPATATLLCDRRDRGPYGVGGGKSGTPGRNLRLRSGAPPEPLPAKAEFSVDTGDRVRIETPGGGGHDKM